MKSEIDKWAENIDDRRVVADFLEWMDSNGYVVAEQFGLFGNVRLIAHSHHALLDEFYEVDNEQLEKERRAVIEEAKKLNE